jgi:hypothetical protein
VLDTRYIEKSKNDNNKLTCPFYEWHLEHCYHIEAKGPEVLQVFQFCFDKYSACPNFGRYAKMPEGVAGLRSIAPVHIKYSEWHE